MGREVKDMSKKKKPTTHQVVKLVIDAVLAIAALITAIRWG